MGFLGFRVGGIGSRVQGSGFRGLGFPERQREWKLLV